MEGNQIKKFRESLGITQEEMAERLGVARNTVARWERDEIGAPPYLSMALRQIRPKQSFNEYLRQVLHEERLSHSAVSNRAKKLGATISPGYINSIVQGHVRSPKVETLQALAKGLGRPESEVFRAAGVNTGETWYDIEVSRFAEMAKSYAALPSKEKQALEVFIRALERAIREALDR